MGGGGREKAGAGVGWWFDLSYWETWTFLKPRTKLPHHSGTPSLVQVRIVGRGKHLLE